MAAQTYGRYRTIRALGSGPLGGTWLAHRPGAAGDPPFVVKTCEPPSDLFMPDQAEMAAAQFLSAARTQRSAAQAAPGSWAPIHECGPTDRGAFYVTDLYARSVQSLISLRATIAPDALYGIVAPIVRGLQSLEEEAHRPHANLRPSNVLVAEVGNGGFRAVVADPLPEERLRAARRRACDAGALTRLVCELITRSRAPASSYEHDEPELVVPALIEWQRWNGTAGRGWFNLTRRLAELAGSDRAPDWADVLREVDDLGRGGNGGFGVAGAGRGGAAKTGLPSWLRGTKPEPVGGRPVRSPEWAPLAPPRRATVYADAAAADVRARASTAAAAAALTAPAAAAAAGAPSPAAVTRADLLSAPATVADGFLDVRWPDPAGSEESVLADAHAPGAAGEITEDSAFSILFDGTADLSAASFPALSWDPVGEDGPPESAAAAANVSGLVEPPAAEAPRPTLVDRAAAPEALSHPALRPPATVTPRVFLSAAPVGMPATTTLTSQRPDQAAPPIPSAGAEAPVFSPIPDPRPASSTGSGAEWSARSLLGRDDADAPLMEPAWSALDAGPTEVSPPSRIAPPAVLESSETPPAHDTFPEVGLPEPVSVSAAALPDAGAEPAAPLPPPPDEPCSLAEIAELAGDDGDAAAAAAGAGTGASLNAFADPEWQNRWDDDVQHGMIQRLGATDPFQHSSFGWIEEEPSGTADETAAPSPAFWSEEVLGEATFPPPDDAPVPGTAAPSTPVPPPLRPAVGPSPLPVAAPPPVDAPAAGRRGRRPLGPPIPVEPRVPADERQLLRNLAGASQAAGAEARPESSDGHVLRNLAGQSSTIGPAIRRPAAEPGRDAEDALDAAALVRRGDAARAGLGRAEGYALAADWYRRAAEAGSGEAMNHIGRMYRNGWGVEQDFTEAMSWYRRAADAGYLPACNSIGYLFQKGLGVTRDDDESARWYRRAADAGDALAMSNLGWMYQQGQGVANDMTQAIRWYGRGADAGSAEAMYNLGHLYQAGRGVPQDRRLAVYWYERAARAGSGAAMKNLGWMYQRGLGVSQDLAAAARWYRAGADASHAAAMSCLAVMYVNGWGVAQDFAKAGELFRRAAEGGSPAGMAGLGAMYENGWGTAPKLDKALKWYARAANAGSAEAMHHVGRFYRNGLGVAQDYRRARRWYKKAAAAGDSDAMNSVGYLYQHGLGVTRDFERARRWYARAAELGNGLAMSNLGWMYQHGAGVPSDLARAAEWYRRGAEAGHGSAMYSLGWMYQHGLGVAADAAAAAAWYRRAGAGGHPVAMYNLGWMSQHGLGVPQDFDEAARWYRRAADFGSAPAMNNLGTIYAVGLGVSPDDVQALSWFRRAAEKGSIAAAEWIGSFYEYGRAVARDLSIAAEWYRRAAANGSNSAGQWLASHGVSLPAVQPGKSSQL